ncbi:ubiquitin carboxyl-terminal hydrolase 22-like [Argiope bruennichi]|uniref:Ubiquitin carboxyl-terminal hydrolase n=1 Tax=Argiope bruennichi TaxID=94029 RepID=A0A8T0EH60_ARGBR|nr:ubiquitin carboxyl-terminal hydrolase 22-like [Argiope bruennichi]KAF8771980.1 Ubiquitin carboxyl-terminal hydrolase 22 like protein [Argiope bruennichi]
MSTHFCEHIQRYKTDEGLTTYHIIQAYFVACVAPNARKKKAADAYCHECKTRANRIHACLSCVFFGCFDEDHMKNHVLANNHGISIDIKNGQIFCYKCNDFIYDEAFETIALQYKKRAVKVKDSETPLPWEPKHYEIQVLKENNGLKRISEDSSIGLRGLLNLGNTCFMNCILQVLVHTPLLRDYFLSDKHTCLLKDSSECIVCEMYIIFQEFYSGRSEPHVPHKLVYLIWKFAKYLIGFDQQDAHEFLGAILGGLHAHARGEETDEQLYHIVSDCDCIVDQVFAGFYQSDVSCSMCSYVSTAIEPFRDISLDLDGTKLHKNGINPNPESLFDCLKRYTHNEVLHNTPCSHCQSYETTSKQLTIRELPVVLCFHLKRLAADSGKKECNKNSTHVMFPETLDMLPFMSLQCGEQKNLTNGNHSKDVHHSDDDHNLEPTKTLFSLFGVVSHKGDQAGGHYIAYIRQYRDRWYLCDDDVIMRSSLKEVLDSEGYLLFYHKQVIEYVKMPPEITRQQQNVTEQKETEQNISAEQKTV